MRFKISLHVYKNAYGYAQAINYRYALSSFIYRTLACADTEYSTQLCQNGFVTNAKRFKLLSFSNLIFPAYYGNDSEGKAGFDFRIKYTPRSKLIRISYKIKSFLKAASYVL